MKFNELYSFFSESRETQPEYILINTLFLEVARSQRAHGPEEMFHRDVNPGVDYSSIFQWLAEHTGDLIHRASFAPLKGGFAGGPAYGFGAVKEKVEKLFRKADEFRRLHKHYHTNPFLESMKNDFNFRIREGHTDLTLEEYQNKFVNAAKKYKDAYKVLNAYTEMQRLSRIAAVSLGNLDITLYWLSLYHLQELLNEGPVGYYTPSKKLTEDQKEIRDALLKLQNDVRENGNQFFDLF